MPQPRRPRERIDQFVEVRDVARDGQRLAAAASLEGLEDPERIREAARDRRHVAGRARAAVQDDDPGTRGSVGTNPAPQVPSYLLLPKRSRNRSMSSTPR